MPGPKSKSDTFSRVRSNLQGFLGQRNARDGEKNVI